MKKYYGINGVNREVSLVLLSIDVHSTADAVAFPSRGRLIAIKFSFLFK